MNDCLLFCNMLKFTYTRGDSNMKHTLFAFGLLACFCASGAYAVSAGTVATNGTSRGSVGYASANTTNTVNRGYQGLANSYLTNQRNTYYMVTQPDVDSACREKIYNCLVEYCGDVTVVPGQRTGRCQ